MLSFLKGKMGMIVIKIALLSHLKSLQEVVHGGHGPLGWIRLLFPALPQVDYGSIRAAAGNIPNRREGWCLSRKQRTRFPRHSLGHWPGWSYGHLKPVTGEREEGGL